MKVLPRLLAALLFSVAPLNARPGHEITRDFPELPPTLPVLAGINIQETRATLYFPEDYTPDRPFPIALLLEGGQGGSGEDTAHGRDVVGDCGWLVLSVPLWKADIAPLAPDRSNWWPRLIVRTEDAPHIWSALEPILDWVSTQVPNIDRERSLLGGFSNGAHTTAALLSHPETAAAVAARFGRFALIDGGTRLRPAVSLQSKHLLLLQGALHHRDLFAEARLSLAASGAELYSRTMPDVGHKFSLQGHAILREWLAAHASPASEGLSRLP